MKKILLLFIGLVLITSVIADIPTGYYDSASGLTGDALKSELHNIIDEHTGIAYGEARYILDETDRDPANSSNLILIYTGNSVSDNWDEGITWNREHVWSQSHGFPDTDNSTIGPGSDLHNLKPSFPAVNTARNEKDFDEGGTPHSIATECYYTDDTWEPRDAVKGDVARIMFYMAVRYQGDVAGEPDLVLVDNLTTYPNPEFGVLSTLLQWHFDDPVDNFERNRNDVIYSRQNNRNPFIDHPEYIYEIWGGEYKNPPPVFSNVINSPEIPADSETVSVSADITDDSEVTDTELRWGLVSGALINTITLTNTSGDLYTTSSDIPAQTDGTTVYFEIEATDDSSGIAISEEYSYTVDNNPPTVLLDEDFSSCPATGWTSYSVLGSEDWECSSSGYLYINAYGGDAASDDWYISPSMDLNLYNGEYLTFSSWTNYSDTYSPTIELKYSTDYTGADDPNLATWIDLSPTWSAVDSETWTESGEIDLSAISGTDVYIAFRYTSSGTTSGTCAIWEIDNILLMETVNVLPDISEINNSPATPTEGEDVIVTATITDSDGTISFADIKWGTTSGTYPNTVPMSNTGDEYSGTIPSQTGGTIVYYIITATDNDPEARHSQENIVSFNTTGNSAPIISGVGFTPEFPGSTEDVIIEATITDDGSITVAQLKWGTSAGDYPNMMDLSASGDNYTGFIPARPEDTHIYFIIYAADNAGGSVQTSESDYIVNNPPVISNVTVNPENPTPSDDVTVSANISDENGTIASANISWGTSTGNYTNTVSMSNSGGDTYTGVIPAQVDGTIVFFVIDAEESGASISLSVEYTYTVEEPENQVPIISDVTQEPANPTEDENVIVSCVVTDTDGTIVSVVLKWKRGSGDYTDVTMNLSGGRYYGQIPKQTMGETIYFSIIAADNNGGETTYESSYNSVTDISEVDDIYENKVSFYPNPASKELNIAVKNYTGEIEVQVYNIIGSLVYTEKSNINKYKISLAEIESGIYFVKITYDNNNVTKKIIVKK